jgi:hypothetical protein
MNVIRVSILVVSRTAFLLNRLLESLDSSYTGSADIAEVLISWNGTREEEAEISTARIPTSIAQRQPYHFAKNMNALARLARGDDLILANDDLIADPGAIDVAIERLSDREDVGIVGAQLRTTTGKLAHAGIHFTSYGSPYHKLENLVDTSHSTNHRERFVPAVTGAFLAIRREDFLRLELAESFNVCGEDALLCLQARGILGKQILFCPTMSGVHNAESTRSQLGDQQANTHDNQRVRSGWLEMIQRAPKETLAIDLSAAQDEAEALREICLELQNDLKHADALAAEIKQLKSELVNAKSELLALRARCTKKAVQQLVVENENKQLKATILHLENQHGFRNTITNP